MQKIIVSESRDTKMPRAFGKEKMKKKSTKFLSCAAASVAALTLLCGTVVSAAVNLTAGADGIYLRNSGNDFTYQVDVPKSHFVAMRIDGVQLVGEKAPVQIDIEVGGTAPEATTAPETQAPKTPSTTAAPTTAAPIPPTTAAPTTSEAPAVTSEAPAVTSEAPPATSEAPAASEVPATSAAPTTSEAPAASEVGPSASGYSMNMGATAVSETPVQALIRLAAPAEANAETYYTTLSIPASYLDSLSDGTHTVVMDFVEGSVSTTITVTSDASMLINGNPSTGDTTNVLPYVLLAAGSACVLVFLSKREKKETR